MDSIRFEVKGKAPLLMHSEKTVNPFDLLTQSIKALTGKRKKTEDDHKEISRLEWLAGLYYTESEGYHIPGSCIDGMLRDSGKQFKLGTVIKQAAHTFETYCEFDFPHKKLKPGTIDAPGPLWDMKEYVDVRGVKVGTAKVNRTRPIFRDWSLSFTVIYTAEKINPDDLVRVVKNGGQFIGLCDYRPRYGQFVVTDVTHNTLSDKEAA